MIRVERGSAPEFVHDGDFAVARERYEQFRSGGGSRATQTYMDLDVALGRYLGPATDYAHQLFNGKCAYTEVAAPPHLHLHRPEVDAYDERLPGAPNHYWWTAFWYRNWYQASPEVASVKRNVFPVIGPRAPEPPAERSPDGGFPDGEVPGEFLDRGMLLDPCEDHPQLHLLFDEKGRVTPWVDAGPAPWLPGEDGLRGPETIRVLDLNSRMLMAHRRKALAPLADVGDLTPDVLTRLVLDPATPHLGAVRQVAAQRLLASAPERLLEAAAMLAPELVPHVLATPGRFTDEVVAAVRESLTATDAVLADLLAAPVAHGAELPPEAPTRPAAPRPGSATITRTSVVTRIVVENFQAIEALELEVPSAVDTLREPDSAVPATKVAHVPADPTVAPAVVSAAARPWRVFLGENGSGKSSALRAVALALAGDDVDSLVERCNLRWGDLLRRGATEGRVRLEFTGEDVIDLRFTADGPTDEARAALPRTEAFVRGFGATRLRSDQDSGRATVRLGNLFDPLQPVVDAQRWLLDLESRPDSGDFNVAAVAIARLLGRQGEVADTGDPDIRRFVRRVGDEIWVADEPLRLLSDGYRAIISLACDLMAGAGRGLSDMRNATGIVLVDELGCYLHPRWKMQITRTLRDVFPSMQFLVTTHEPLCLRGLVEREVVRVTRSSTDLGAPWRAEFEVVEESPSRYRVDRLLTSSFFGLDTTIDPEVDQEFQQYYALVRRTDGLSDEEDETRRRLRARLSQHGILGYTARDQLVYDAIDLFLATSPTLDPEQRRQERRRTLDNVAEIWRTVAAQRETTPS
jgi:hypothetical protein